MKRAAVLLLTAALAACGSADQASDADPADTLGAAPTGFSMGPGGAGAPANVPPRPSTIQDTLSIEGENVVETWTLVRPEASQGFPFTTYSPKGIATSLSSDASGSSVRFNAAFSGTPDIVAYMEVRLVAPGAPPLHAEDIVSSFLEVRAPGNHEFTIERQPTYANASYRFRYERSGVPIVGSVALGMHSGRYFYVLTHYPAEYGDGFAPRLQRILELWRWEDSGQMLIAPAAPTPKPN